MTSSEIARAVVAAVVVVSAMALTSAQLRVLKRPRPRRSAYLVAWVVCAAVMGGLVSKMDDLVGAGSARRIVLNFAAMSVVAALALAAGAWWVRRSAWSGMRGAARTVSLLVLHALVVLLSTYWFI